QGQGRLMRRGLRVLMLTLAALVLSGSVMASADTTSVSSVSKRGSDPTTGSSAVAGGPSGTTKAGDTINWVLDYANHTGSSALVSVGDRNVGNQSIVRG